jgi:succinate dehydrogenase / fumarate reductase iron-sulfur subunit
MKNSGEDIVELKEVCVTCYRFDPAIDKEPRQEIYVVPIQGVTTILNVLEYIQKNHDPSLAYYSCCRRGLCKRCRVKVNGLNVLACEMVVNGNIVIEPVSEKKVDRDLVVF